MSWLTGSKTNAETDFYLHAASVVPLAGRLFKLCTNVSKSTQEE